MRHFFLFSYFCILLGSSLSAGEGYLKSKLTPAINYVTAIDVTETSSGMEPIDCVYVINLNERPERWQRIERLLEERGIHANRVAAINGWQLPADVVKKLTGPYPVKITGGALGCLLSHFSVYKDALERGYNLIWVLEDDADFIEDIRQIPGYLKTLSEIDPDWDIFYTDIDCRNDAGGYFAFVVSSSPRPDQPLKSLGYYSLKLFAGEGLLRVLGRYGTTSALITKGGLKKIVNYLSHVYIATAIDCDLHFIPEIREYCPTKEIVTNLRGDAASDTKPWSTLNL